MDKLFPQILALIEAGEPFSLATVAHTSGSTPQKAGAKAVFLPDGRILGTLGGGCMEAEARRRGLQLVQGGEPELLELHLDDDFGWDDGLICGGTAHIFIQPMRDVHADVFRATLQLQEARGRGVLALVLRADNADAVAQMCLVRDDAETVGNLHDATLQAAVQETARGLLLEGREEPRRMKVAGAEVYFEPLLPRPVLFIAGAGHIGGALCHFAARCGFEVAIVDDRASLCNAERLPDADHVIVDDIVEAARRWPMTPDTYFVLVTRGHKHDAVVLREIVNAPVAYIGMIGSRRKILTIWDEFIAEGIATPETLARIHAPVGLDIGGLSVDEIALSITAELILVRRKGARYGYGDRAGSGGEPTDGTPEAALAVREANRDRGSRSLVEALPEPRRARGARSCPG